MKILHAFGSDCLLGINKPYFPGVEALTWMVHNDCSPDRGGGLP